MAKPAVGEIVKSFRKKIGLSQNDLAKYLKVHREVISNYETGSRRIPLEKMQRLADLFGVELADLINPDSTTAQTNTAFAFRANGLSEKDLDAVAAFRKIVKNYTKMKAKFNRKGVLV